MPLPPAPPGTLIRSEPLPAPVGVRGWRILYHSRTLADADIAVSGTVFAPTTPAPPTGRPVVAWAHGTTGSGDSCAPSTDLQPLNGIEDGTALLAAGDVIVASDYEGLGTPGPHPYLVGASEARSVLDAVRAAIHLPEAGTGNAFAVFGHSQGGQAALAVGQLAATYAPDLHLIAAAATAPPTDLTALTARLTHLDYGIAYLVEAAAGYSATDPSANLSAILTPKAAASLPLLETGCTDDLITAYAGMSIQDTFIHDPRTTPPWSTGFARAAIDRLPGDLPILILQGSQDPIVSADITTATVHRLCAAGDLVDYHLYPEAAHNVVPAAADDLNTWLAGRFQHQPPPTTCR